MAGEQAIGETGGIDTVTKIGGAHCGKNGWSSLWKKWVELTMAKMGTTDVKDTVAKMGETHCGKNGWSSPWQKWVKLVLKTPWQKWVKLILAKKGGAHHGKNG